MTTLAPSQEFAAGARSALSTATIYCVLRAGPTASALADPFSAHVFACALAVGLSEARDNLDPLSFSLGLDRPALASLTEQWAPAARRFFSLETEPLEIVLDEEESQIFELLNRFKRDQAPVCSWMTSIVARRAMSPRHLWQDLGLIDRGELTRLMGEWFPALGAANVDNMKWKKFFYRKLCEMEGFSLCAAPTCRECGDFDSCFGAEDGASLLARTARR